MRMLLVARLVLGGILAVPPALGAQRVDRVAYAPAHLAGAVPDLPRRVETPARKPSFIKHVGIGAAVGGTLAFVGGMVMYTASAGDPDCWSFCDPPGLLVVGMGAGAGVEAGVLVYLAKRLFPDDPPSAAVGSAPR